MEIVDEAFISVGGFFSDIFLGEEVGVGRGSGCVSLYDLICSIVVRGSVCVVWDVDRSFGPVDFRVDFLQPGCPQDDIFISTIDDVEQDSVDDSFDANECGGDELDGSGFIV